MVVLVVVLLDELPPGEDVPLVLWLECVDVLDVLLLLLLLSAPPLPVFTTVVLFSFLSVPPPAGVVTVLLS